MLSYFKSMNSRNKVWLISDFNLRESMSQHPSFAGSNIEMRLHGSIKIIKPLKPQINNLLPPDKYSSHKHLLQHRQLHNQVDFSLETK